MLNFTPATAVATTAQATTAMTAEANALQAATRPLAGFGAGAFMCDGAWVGSLVASPMVDEMAAALALPRIKPAIGAVKTSGTSTGHAKAGTAGAAHMTSLIDIVPVDSVQQDVHNFIQTTRLYLVTPGGVGPHPAREPVPV
jgi:hypothetical protein